MEVKSGKSFIFQKIVILKSGASSGDDSCLDFQYSWHVSPGMPIVAIIRKRFMIW